jgi:hypothetical protein
MKAGLRTCLFHIRKTPVDSIQGESEEADGRNGS